MKVLKARLKKGSKYYTNGLNQKGKPIYLKIVSFQPQGEKNYQIEAVKEVKNGMPVFFLLWVQENEIKIKSIEDGQLSFEF